MEKKYGCECYFCEMHRKLTEARHAKDFCALDEIAQMLGNRAINAEFEREYYQAILEGWWPTSVEILEDKLAHAKEKRQLEE